MLYLVTLQRYRMPEIYTDPQMARPVFRIKLHKNEKRGRDYEQEKVLHKVSCGYIKTAGIEITLIVVPVAVGAVTLGPAAGAILGGVFGLASFLRCFGLNAFGAMLLSINPFLAFLLYVPTRILTGWLTGLIYQGIRKTKIPSNVSITIANLCCPLLNTTFFMSMLVFGFYQTEYIQSFVQTLGVSNPFLFVIAFVGINGLVEAVVCFIVGTAISAALKKALKYS